MTQPDDVNAPVPDEESGDPDALDTGDFLEVPESERTDVDDDPPNADADDPLEHVEEGEVVNLEDSEDDEDDDEPPAEGQVALEDGENPPPTSGPPAEEDEGPSSAGG